MGYQFNMVSDTKQVEKYCQSKKVRAIFIDLSEFPEFKLNSECKIQKIGIIGEKISSEVRKSAIETGFSMFLRSDADEYEISLNLTAFGIFRSFEEQIVYETSSPTGLLNQLSVPVFIKDKNSVFKACNEAFCQYLGFSREEIFGKTSEHFSPRRKARIYEEVDRLVAETGKKRSYEGMVSYSGDSVNSIIIQKSPLFDENGEMYGILGVITDISDRKKREKELKSAMKKAEESDKLKSSFLSNMSHEIRTPMNAIVGFSQLLSTPNLNDEKKQIYIEQVNLNSEILLKLIEDIIEVSKIEAGKISIKKSTCFVNQMLDELYTSFETHSARQGKTHVKLILKKTNKSQMFNIITDGHRLNQILTNLLGNAIKFTEEGSVEFGYYFSEENEQKYVKFYVKDTGLGINKAKMEYVFDRFSKIPAGKTKLYGGTGLGLSISKSLTEMLGGTISLESEENVGSVFYFTIPYVTENKEIHISDEKIIKKQTKPKNYFWAGKTILIAEDEEMNYLYLQEVLRETKANVIWKANGAAALAEVENNRNIDMILMDIKMPQMDGYEATQKIRKFNTSVPVIIQTAYAMPAEKKKGFECGCDEYLEKPIKQKDLLEIIDKYFNRKIED
jgi:PAS domain S-box-containing protein